MLGVHDHLQVIVRIKPMGLDESANFEDQGRSALELTEQSISLERKGDRKGRAGFSFTKVLGEQSTQEDVWAQMCGSVDGVMAGTSMCVMAYGQTGSQH